MQPYVMQRHLNHPFFFGRKNIAYFSVFSHQNISHLFMVLDSLLTFKEQITHSSAKVFGQVKGVRNRKWIDTQGVNGALYNEQAKN